MRDSKWQVVRPLGEGGTGQVWLAKAPQGDEVAVKLLSSHEHLPLWEHEVRLLMRMRHPAIAPILGCLRDSSEIFGENRGPCFWMEYVPGDDLLKSAESRGRDPGILQGWLVQGLQALEYLHSQDVLHGDLSSGNLRVEAGAGLRLIDFGTASLSGSNPASRAATLLYLAPERIGGKNSAACDVFSLGTLFYEALSGKHPRAGCRSLSEMIRRPAKPLLEARPDLGEGHAVMARTIDRMILTDPATRFSRVDEVLEALRGGRPKSAPASILHPVKMIGASQILETVGNALETLGDRSRLFALHGVTGVGRKRFLREIGFQCALSGRSVCEVQPAAFRSGLEGLAAAHGAVFFRSLENVAPMDLALLLRVARREIPEKNVLVLWEWNDDAVPEGARRILESFAAHPDIEDLRLTNLSEADTKELVLSAMPGVPPERAEETAVSLYRMTGGNPLLLLQSLRLEAPSQEARTPPDFQYLLRVRVRELSDPERHVLGLMAVAPNAVDADPLLRAFSGGVLGSDVLDAVAALDRLAAKGLIALEPDTGRYRLGVSGLREVIQEDLGEDGRIKNHQAWRAAFSSETPADAEVLHHALALGDAPYAERFAHGVVEGLWKEKQLEEALKLAEGSLALLKSVPNDVETSKMLRLKVNVLNELGRFGETLALCEEIRALAAADEPAAFKTVKYWLITGLGHQNLGHYEEAEKRFRRCLEEYEALAGEIPVTYAMRCRSLIGMEALRRGDLVEARLQFSAGLAFEEYRGWRRAEICRNLAVVHHKEGDAAGALGLWDEARRLYAEESNEDGVYAAWLQEGNLALEREDFAVCERAYCEAEKIAAARKDDLLLASVWNNQGILERRRGDLARSLERLQKALDVFRPLGNWSDLAESLKQNAITEAQVGRFEAVEHHIADIRLLVARVPQAVEKVAEAEAALGEFRDGQGASAPDDAANKRLHDLYKRLPKALQVSFEDRFDYKRIIQEQRKDAPP